MGPRQAMRPDSSAIGYIIFGIVVSVATLWAYLRPEQIFFLLWDDYNFVLDNPRVVHLNAQNLWKTFFDYHFYYWHPVTVLSFALDYSLWGAQAKPFRLNNVLLHLASSVLVFFLILGVLRNRPTVNVATRSDRSLGHNVYIPAALMAAVFAVHPMHVESVAWISQRKDVLCTFFYLASVITYLKYGGRVESKRWLSYSLVFALLALMSKPVAVSLPVILLLLDIYPLDRLRPGQNLFRQFLRLMWEKRIFILVTLCVATIVLIVQRGAMVLEMALWPRVINAAYTVLFYLQKSFIPVGLSPFYPFPDFVSSPSLISGLPIIVVLTIFVACGVAWRLGQRFWLVAWLSYLVMLLPTLGIVQVGRQAAADRYAYLPKLALLVLVAGLLIHWLESRSVADARKRAMMGLLGLLVISGLFAITVKLVPVWSNDIDLWQRVVAIYPNRAALAHQNLGAALMRKGERGHAVEHYQKSLQLDPTLSLAHYNLALLCENLGERACALENFRRLLELEASSAWAYQIVGDAYRRAGLNTKATNTFRAGIQVALEAGTSPAYEKLFYTAYFQANLGKSNEAIRSLGQALSIKPDYIDALHLLARLHRSRAEWKKAREYYQKILDINPNQPHIASELKRLGK